VINIEILNCKESENTRNFISITIHLTPLFSNGYCIQNGASFSLPYLDTGKELSAVVAEFKRAVEKLQSYCDIPQEEC